MADHDSNEQAIRPPEGGMLAVEIASALDRIKASPEWSRTGRHALSLVKDKALNVMLLAMKKDAVMHEHRTKGPIAIQVLSGTVRFRGGAQELTLSQGMLAALDREVPHSLEALEESALILITAIG